MIDRKAIREFVKLSLAESEMPRFPNAPSGQRCWKCNREMTNEEVAFYSDSCESCETIWHERIKAWRAGAHDPALDAGRFDGIPEVH